MSGSAMTAIDPNGEVGAVDSEGWTGPVIEARGLSKRYGPILAVDDLDLAVEGGEIYGLLGPNGAGKTTTILMLLGLSEPTAGSARVMGLDPTRDPKGVKRRVGYLPDDAGFYGTLTGRQNLRYTARLNGLTGPVAEGRIDEVLELVALSDRADDRAEGYSRGMRQRLGIADALVKGPDVLILDEPTTAIDPIGVVEILDLIRRLARDEGLAILLASHLLDQVQVICQRVGIFHAGRLVAEGTVDELVHAYHDGGQRLEIGLVDGRAALDDRVGSTLGSVPGVASVVGPEARAGRAPTWRLELAPAADRHAIADAVAGRVIEAGWHLDRLEVPRTSLEGIYRRAVGGDDRSADDRSADDQRPMAPDPGPPAGGPAA
jgi:ABC-2 type transport system ATP-binding protein